MSIFERQALPLAAAPLYYQALADLVNKHWSRLWKRIDNDEAEAKAYLNLFRGESSAFTQTVISHIDQQAKSQRSSAERKQAIKDILGWVGLIRRGAGVAARRSSVKVSGQQLKTLLHVGRDLSSSSAGEILLEAKYLTAILPEVARQLSPPLHADELTRGDGFSVALETALYGRANATAEQLNASVAKGKAWNILEEKSKLLLELARLEFSKDPAHEDYATRLQFEGLDEKFAPAEKPSAEPVSADPNAPGAKK